MRFASILPILAMVVSCHVAHSHSAETPVDYNRDVRPLLSNHCYQCHGPDNEQRATEMRLDQLDNASARHDSGIPIVPGNSAQSEVQRRISSADPGVVMPPPETGRRLTPEEVRTITRWIDEGANWGNHWSFVKPVRPRPDAVRNRDWPTNAIDAFVLARLDAAGLTPAPRAGRATLIRRVTFALTGLPPTPAEAAAFLQDPRPDAYELLVDRLLHSPRYGEHMARHWLDVARYGDTHGLHLDNERSIWRYRDWVIEACNENLPFDQFTVEQLAGDLLPQATVEQRVATGFHRCNVTTSEGGAIAEEFLARYAVDRVETTSAVWLGLTAGCAACHDHKYDPISQREFYQLFAYFNNQTERAMDGNALLPPPAIKAPTYLQRRRRQRLDQERVRLESRLDALRGEAASQRDRWEPQLAQELRRTSPPGDAQLVCRFNGSPRNEIGTGEPRVAGKLDWIAGRHQQAWRLDGSSFAEYQSVGDFEANDAFSFSVWVKINSNDQMAVLSKMQDDLHHRGYDLYLGQRKIYVHLIHHWDGDAIRVNTRLPIRKEKWQHICVTYDGSTQARGIKIFVDGVLQELEVTHDRLTGSLRTARAFRIGGRDDSAPFRGAIDEVRVYDRALSEDEVSRLLSYDPLAEILQGSAADRSKEQDRELVDAFLRDQHAEAGRLFHRLETLRKQIRQLESQFPSTLVMQDRTEPRETFVLVRGQYDQAGEKVVAATPRALPALDADAEGSRLTLARWLTHPEHPLTARVAVNRIWQQHFGVGIVKTSEDFGAQGDWPSHPRLLDYLATELIRSGWDIKAIHRLILTSSTYQQSSVVTSSKAAADPENRLLSRGPRYRLDAEAIRDMALAVSGLLVGEIGGPSVKPYQPTGLWEAVGYPSSTTARFERDTGAALYRRSMYTFWKRTSPPPGMQILDAPSREVCIVRRARTNTPAAALLLMNDVQFVEAARLFATRLLRECAENDSERLDIAYRYVLTRSPNSGEQETLVGLLVEMRAAYQAHPELAAELLNHGDAPVPPDLDPRELAAWTMVANTLLNLDEAINQH